MRSRPTSTAQGGGHTVILVYLFGVMATAVVGILVPMVIRLAADFGCGTARIGLVISVFSLPSAILSAVGGNYIDRIGLRRSIVISASLIILGEAILLTSNLLAIFGFGMGVAGLGMTGMLVACPSLLLASTTGPRTIRAMSLWSTNAPMGFSTGLLIAAPFTIGGHWRTALALHAGLMCVLVLFAGLLPLVESGALGSDRVSVGTRLRQIFGVFRNVRAVRLAATVAIPNAISYGTSLVAPSYLARIHGISLAASATTVAIAKICAMLIGSVLMAQLLTRRMPPRAVFAVVVVIGITGQVLIYLPASSFPLAAAALILWIFAFGGAVGTAMARLPMVIQDPRRSGPTTGLVSQFVAIASFATPNIYFAMSGWHAFVGFAVVGLVASLLLLPTGGELVADRS